MKNHPDLTEEKSQTLIDQSVDGATVTEGRKIISEEGIFTIEDGQELLAMVLKATLIIFVVAMFRSLLRP